MAYQTILYEVRDGVALATLNRPEARNALDIPMREELADLVLKIRRDDSLKALVLTGAGRTFCAGGDLKALSAGRASAQAGRKRIQNLHVWLPELIDLELPVVAAVDGPAFGAGFNLALAADFVLATPRARFCAVFGRIGLVPDLGGFFLLPRIVGLQTAKDLIFSARSIDSQEAKELGIVHRVLPEDGFVDAAVTFAGRFRHASREAIGLAKTILNASFHSDQRTLGQMESYAQGIAVVTDYHGKAVERFLDKKPLEFDWDAMERAERSRSPKD